MVREKEELALTHKIYCFQCYLRYRPKFWRSIEIAGEQTLGIFDRILREAFQHEQDDHLSGLWKKIPLAPRRFKEVDLGSIDPFGIGLNIIWF